MDSKFRCQSDYIGCFPLWIRTAWIRSDVIVIDGVGLRGECSGKKE